MTWTGDIWLIMGTVRESRELCDDPFWFHKRWSIVHLLSECYVYKKDCYMELEVLCHSCMMSWIF